MSRGKYDRYLNVRRNSFRCQLCVTNRRRRRETMKSNGFCEKCWDAYREESQQQQRVWCSRIRIGEMCVCLRTVCVDTVAREVFLQMLARNEAGSSMCLVSECAVQDRCLSNDQWWFKFAVTDDLTNERTTNLRILCIVVTLKCSFFFFFALFFLLILLDEHRLTVLSLLRLQLKFLVFFFEMKTGIVWFSLRIFVKFKNSRYFFAGLWNLIVVRL